MKILFIENRYKTALWELLGYEFEKLGHEVHWLVQNHMFKPTMGKVEMLPYPKHRVTIKEYTSAINKILQADRGLNYFGIESDDFIFWYQQEIKDKIELIKPDLVFGESTLFHELLVIEECKKRNILYLHPTSCRYPVNRFSFYIYDTLIPYGYSEVNIDKQELDEIANAIGKRLKLPDYMQVSKNAISRFDWIKDKIRLTVGYYLGEKYNTPSPIRKRAVQRDFAKRIREWEQLAVSSEELSNSDFYVLYALQMQPEANIDVWGYPYNNQSEVIERVVKELREDEKLVIKPNPKSKYEITETMIQLIKSRPDKIVLLSHNSKMNEIWHYVRMVVTVTGTISLECIFDNKPVVMLGQGLQTEQKNCKLLKPEDDLRKVIDTVKSGQFPVLNDEEKRRYLQKLFNTSFIGINGDGLHNRRYLDDICNRDFLVRAYCHIINEVNESLEK